jgi:hypothetical protein
MRLWKKAVPRVPVTAVPLPHDAQRLAADARNRIDRDKAAFEIVIARIERDAATPALGKETPQLQRAPY